MRMFKIEGSNVTITVGRNNSDENTRLDNSVYIYAQQADGYKNAVGSLSADEAEELANKLIEISGEVRDVVAEKGRKDKPKSFNEQTAHLGEGAVVAYLANEKDSLVKLGGIWRHIDDAGKPFYPDELSEPGSWPFKDWTVLFEGIK